MTRAQRIELALQEALSPLRLVVFDDSHKHAGHAGARPEGETHYRIEIVSAVFAGQNRVARQRLVNKILAPEFDAGLHALQMKTLAPDEE